MTQAPLPDRARVLAVHAHPDDESLLTGGTLARFARSGSEVTLITCTAGELGARAAGCEADPATARLRELRAACRVLGVASLRLLGYADSGNMVGGMPSQHSFARCDTHEALTRVAAIIREVRPDVVIAYDARGTYGHPDHVRAHEVTVAAVAAAAQPSSALPGVAWQASRLWYTVLPESVVRGSLLAPLLEVDSDLFDDETRAEEIVARWGTRDAEANTTIDVTDTIELKYAALRCYHSQAGVLRPFLEQPAAERPHHEYFHAVSCGVAA